LQGIYLFPAARGAADARWSGHGRVEHGPDGKYVCHQFGSNVDSVRYAGLDDVAAALRTHTRSGVRMNLPIGSRFRTTFILMVCCSDSWLEILSDTLREAFEHPP